MFLVAAGSRGIEAGPAAAYRQIAQVLRHQDLTIVQERVFGSLSVKAAVMAARTTAFQEQGLDPDGPLTYIHQAEPTACWSFRAAGSRVTACISRTVSPPLP